MSLALPPSAATRRPERVAVSRLEHHLLGTLHGWAIRSVYDARLAAIGQRQHPVLPHDVYLSRRINP